MKTSTCRDGTLKTTIRHKGFKFLLIALYRLLEISCYFRWYLGLHSHCKVVKISAERVLQWLLEKVEAGAGSVDVGGHLYNIYQWSERRKEHEIVLHTLGKTCHEVNTPFSVTNLASSTILTTLE